MFWVSIGWAGTDGRDNSDFKSNQSLVVADEAVEVRAWPFPRPTPFLRPARNMRDATGKASGARVRSKYSNKMF